jgi:tRNA dimethylallyltransferase
MKHLITIVGPTAIGKQLKHYFGKFLAEIISCDSRQFFKEMTIGTAVPTTAELTTAPHHFIQNKSIFENYTVGEFEKEAVKNR